MRGWHKNRRGGRGGHGNGSVRGRERSAKRKSHTEKTLQGYFFNVGSRKTSSDYNIMDEVIVNHTKKTSDHGNYVSEALQTLSKVDTDI